MGEDGLILTPLGRYQVLGAGRGRYLEWAGSRGGVATR